VRIRRPDRLVAASLLTALGACLALLAQPSAASSLDSYDIRASVRYGCAQHGEDSFVEVTLQAQEWDDDHPELLLQVGLAGPESPDSADVFPEGGPSLVTLGEDPTKIRLAGPAHDGDHVFLRQVDRPEVINLPLQATCHKIKPTNFGLAEPAVRVAAKSCTSGSQANLKVTLDNPNEVDRQLEKIGIEQIDYTVLLVRQDGQLAGTDPIGTLVSFDEPSSAAITVSQVVPKPARYEVRVIALDGAVVTSDSLRLSCAVTGTPGPSSTSRPTPSVSVTLPSSRPPSTPAHTPTATVTRPPTTPAPSTSAAPSSPARTSTAPASSAPASSAPASSAPPATGQPPAPATSSPAGSVGGPTAGSSASRSSGPTSRPSNSGVQPPNATPSGPSSSAAPSSSTPSAEPSVIRLVEPQADYGGLPVFQREVALVVLVFSAALTALVGSAVINARRR
jgi:hypothetical protein